jgi:acetone carboxylase gamma subunit
LPKGAGDGGGGKVTHRLSHSVAVRKAGDRYEVCCFSCGYVLGVAGGPWKPASRMVELPLNEMPVKTYTTADEVVLRRFYCPQCSRLLDTESAVRGDPVLNDILYLGPR